MVSRIYKKGRQISAKKIVLLVLLVLPCFFVVGQENPLDLVLLLDTSSSMSGSYQKTLDYVTGSFLKEFLRMGDTFHLISFSDTPRMEITRRITGWGDVETIMGRLFLLYPLEPYSDIAGALAYGERYAASIPGARKKKVVLISDGNQNPRQGGTAEDTLPNLISQTTARLTRAGIDFYYVPVSAMEKGPSSGRSRMPPIPPPVPSRPPAVQPSTAGPAASTQTARPETAPAQPSTAGPATSAQTARPETAPPRPSTAGPATSAQTARPETVPPRPSTAGPAASAQTARPETAPPQPATAGPATSAQTTRPETVPPQPSTAGPATSAQPARPETVPPRPAAPEPRQPEAEAPAGAPSTKGTDQEPSPQKPAPGYQSGAISLFGLPLPWFVGGILGVILILAFIIFLMIKRLQTSPNRAFAHAAAPPAEPVLSQEPEPAKDDGAAQAAAYPRHQNEEQKPRASLAAFFLKREPPAATVPQTQAAETAPNPEAAETPVPAPGPQDRQDTGRADMAGGSTQNPEARPRAPWWKREPPAPAETVSQTQAAEAAPNPEAAETPVPAPGPQDRRDTGRADMAGGSTQNHPEARPRAPWWKREPPVPAETVPQTQAAETAPSPQAAETVPNPQAAGTPVPPAGSQDRRDTGRADMAGGPTQNPAARPRAPWWKREPPAETVPQTQATETAPNPQAAGTPVPPAGPQDRQDTGRADMTGGSTQNPEVRPRAPWWKREPPAPAETVSQTQAAETAPNPQAAGTPVPSAGSQDRRDTGRADMAGGRPISYGGPRRTVKSYQTHVQAADGPLMLSLFVEDQNTNIGRRNIHTVKSGYSFTIGGGKSDFLIFLVPIPPRIAELRSEGGQCTFIPRRPEFFPDLGSQQVPNCVGIPIRIISERHYELYIRIDRYEDPLIALNRLLHSVDVPGPGYGHWQTPP